MVQPDPERHHPAGGRVLQGRAGLRSGKEPQPQGPDSLGVQPASGAELATQGQRLPVADRLRPVLLLPSAQPVEQLHVDQRVPRRVDDQRQQERQRLPLPACETGAFPDADRPHTRGHGLPDAAVRAAVPDRRPARLRAALHGRQPVLPDRAPDRLPARQADAAAGRDRRRERLLRAGTVGALPCQRQPAGQCDVPHDRGLAARVSRDVPGAQHVPVPDDVSAELSRRRG